MKTINYIVLAIAIIGAVNWGLIGIFNFNLVSFLFGQMSWLSRIVYTLVGLSGLYLITFYGQLDTQQQQELYPSVKKALHEPRAGAALFTV